jgi:hypothetical protein
MKKIFILMMFYSVSTLGRVVILNKKVDAMTDKTTHMLAINSTNHTFGKKKDTLYYRKDCGTGKGNFFIVTSWPIKKSKYGAGGFTMRFDKEKVLTFRDYNLDVPSSSSTLIRFDMKNLVSKFQKSKKFIFRYPSSGGGEKTPIFSLEGFSQSAKTLCK